MASSSPPGPPAEPKPSPAQSPSPDPSSGVSASAQLPLGARVGYVLRLLFGLRLTVERRTYALAGCVLMALKYALDAGAVYLATGGTFTPLDYLNPVLSMRAQATGPMPMAVQVAMVLWTLPFMWIGVSMSLRRSIHAGRSPWWCVLFFVPVVNYVYMLTLCLLPPAAEGASARPIHVVVDAPLRGALIGVAAGVVLTLAMTALSVFVLGTYGASLFVGTPFIIGVTTGFAFNRGGARTPKATIGVASLAILLSGLGLLLFALEGVLCLLMAAPLALAVAIPGALVGAAIAQRGNRSWTQTALLILFLPLFGAAESQAVRTPLYQVATTIDIDAAPDQVWPNVIGFSELPVVRDFWFERGVAHPVRARISGSGVGAVRYCEFSTGAFVEPITVWEPPTRLAFDVTAQPPSMREWSPYEDIHAPHIEHSLRSQRGEFVLTELPDGRTRLVGSTWYTLDLFPQAYWSLWSDKLIHDIHGQVLAHIAALSEGTR